MKKRRRKITKIIHSDGTESGLERQFLRAWTLRYPHFRPVTQYRFHPTRKWQYDFAWVHKKVAVEIQGMGPGHCSLPGMTQDYDKHLAAIQRGWKIVYLTTIHLSPQRIDCICRNIAELLQIPLVSTATTYVPVKRRYR